MINTRGYRKSKEERAIKAQKHTQEMEELYEEEIAESVRDTIIYSAGFKCKKNTECDTGLVVEPLDSVSAIMKYAGKGSKTAVLNFASYKNPGGKFTEGSCAQEECLCHSSFLYNVLSRLDAEYYEWNRCHKNRALYLNRGAYSPNIVFNQDSQSVTCDVITCAAPNKSAAQKYLKVSDEENTEALKSRISFVLDLAKENEVEVLILGAFGCGVFGQDPREVASIFKECLETTHKCFKKVIFAIPGKRDKNFTVFEKVFS